MKLPPMINPPRPVRPIALPCLALAVLLWAAGCGTTSRSTGSSSPTTTAPEVTAEQENASFGNIRRAVLAGAARDFAQGTGAGGPAFASCVQRLLGGALDRPTIARLVAVYRRQGGQQFAAQALNRLAFPLAARCGHRTYVPELVEASRGLRGHLPAAGPAKDLAVGYGPYLGVKCARAGHVECDRVGIDIVFSRPAKGVVAIVGGRRLRLRTPGMHNGVPRHDWVGTVVNAGTRRPGSPFHVPGRGPAHSVWAGSPAVYVPVELRVAFAGGQRAAGRFPSVFLSPGWG